MDELKIDRTAFSVVPLSEAGTDIAYWLSKTAEERRQGIEICRQIAYGEEACTLRMVRVLEIVSRESNPPKPE